MEETIATTDPFILLREANLLGKPLLEVRGSELIARYNACLKEMDIEPTALNGFSIDCMGYSPEIAAEKGDLDYLSHGGISNPYAIIISSEQQALPIMRPYYSFYEGMMNVIFKTFKDALTELTLRTACYIDLEDGFDHIESPQALMLLEGIYPRFHVIGPIVEAAKFQREGALLIMKEGEDHWAEDELIEKMRQSVRQYGDLRYQRMQLRDLPYMQVRSFYTSAFGGVYIFRDADRNDNVLISVKGDKVYRTENGHSEYQFGDSDLYNKLEEHSLTDLDAEYYLRDVTLQKLERLAECMFVNAVTSKDEKVSLIEMTPAKRVKRAQKLLETERLPLVYDEILTFAQKLRLGRGAPLKKASKALKQILAHPHRDIKDTARLVVHRLLVHLQPIDILDLYKYARETFLEMYETWPENKKLWAVDLLKKQLYSTV